MKQLFNISSNFSFYLALGFLFLINFSIAGCYLIFIIFIIQLILFLVKKKKWPKLPEYYKYFLLYILFSLISTIFSINKLNSLKDNKEFFIFLLVPIFILIINSRKRLDYSLFTVLISAVISSLIGIIISIKDGISLDHRLQGLTSHWMTYSGLLMFTFIFFFVYFFYEKRKKIKIILVFSLLLILASILLSLTRSVWVGIIISIGIFIIYYRPKILYAAVPGLILLLFILPGSVMSRMTSMFDMSNETTRDRFYMFKTAINIFKDKPFMGVGANNIKEVYNTYKPREAELSNPHLHNNFLHVLAERGIFTLISLLVAFISIFILLINKIKNSINFEKTVSICVLFAFMGFLIAGMFEYNFGDTEIKFILFYFLSIPFIRLNLKDEKN